MFRFFNRFAKNRRPRKIFFALTLYNSWPYGGKEKNTPGWHKVCLMKKWVYVGFESEPMGVYVYFLRGVTMKSKRTNRPNRRRAMVTFEWILLISLLVIGIIGGLSAVRNAILCELQDLANCIAALQCTPPGP